MIFKLKKRNAFSFGAQRLTLWFLFICLIFSHLKFGLKITLSVDIIIFVIKSFFFQGMQWWYLLLTVEQVYYVDLLFFHYLVTCLMFFNFLLKMLQSQVGCFSLFVFFVSELLSRLICLIMKNFY